MSEALEKYLDAGRIAAKLKNEVSRIVKVETPLLEICERLENLTFKLGGEPAFPLNIGVDDVTAHYTSPAEDESRIPEDSIVKIDLGIHIQGYIADTAVTLTFNPNYEDLAASTEEALKAAVEAIKPGVKVSQIGAVIEKTINRFGYKPIRNLMGHRIERYSLHTGKSIPNVSGFEGGTVMEGEIYAVEPFATLQNATGLVRDSPKRYIFRYVKERRLKSKDAKAILEHVKNNYRTLPFASRWLAARFPRDVVMRSFKELMESRCIHSYNVLVEASGKPVAQAEHTVIVERDGCRVIT
ncbi:MAG: type II methionyl aminopeptidase [Candidatus Bathyarchaeia archaeon]|nr:type II methionyl aminopeptidase [Candidatus Bathyarchaeota archaeon]